LQWATDQIMAEIFMGFNICLTMDERRILIVGWINHNCWKGFFLR
jgi:hypothetical protein